MYLQSLPELTDHTVGLEKGFFLAATVGEGETSGVELVAICNLTAGCL